MKVFTGGKMNPREKFKTRPSINEARESIVDFFTKQQLLTVGLTDSNTSLILDSIDYFYFEGEHIAVLSPMSRIGASIETATQLSVFCQVGKGKMAQKLYGTCQAEIIENDTFAINELAKTNPMIQKMKAHHAKFLKLTITEGVILLSDQEIYTIDNALTPQFAQLAPNGKKRYENSRKVLMTYLDREVIFNCVIEEDTYYALTNKYSNKIQYIEAGGTCTIYDGKDNHFETKISIIPEKTNELFHKLKATNNAYFKENIDLVAVCFKKQ